MAFSLSGVPFEGLRQKYGRFGERIWFLSLILLLMPVYLGFWDMSAMPALRWGLVLGSLVGYGLLCLKICFLDGHSGKELLCIALILGLIALGVLRSGTRSLLSVFLLAFAARDVPFSKIVSAGLFFFLFVLAANTLLVLCGVLEDTLVIRGETWGQGNVRHTLGFGYPNTLALWCMVSIYALLLTRKKGVFFLLPVLSYLAFRLTDSKAAFLSSLLAFILYCVFRLLPLSGKRAGMLAAAMIALIAAVYTLLTLLYTPQSRFLELANTLLSQRLGYSLQGLRRFGISLFGARVDFGWDPVDSLYTYGPICLGLVPSMLYLLLTLLASYRAAAAGHWEIAAVAIAGALYSTMEYSLINPIFLPVYAAFAPLSAVKKREKP